MLGGAVADTAEALGGFFLCYSEEAAAVILGGVAEDTAAEDLAAEAVGLEVSAGE